MIGPASDDQVFLYSRHQVNDDKCNLNLFSVPAPRNSTVKNRAVVEFLGMDDGTGSWKCLEEPNRENCLHILAARHSLQQHIRADKNARDLGADSSEPRYVGRTSFPSLNV